MDEAAILIVEDDATQRDLLGRFLASKGYAVVPAGDVAAARSALDEARPALVITDYDLPDGNGLDVLRHARAADSEMPVLLITAYGTVAVAVEAMREGAADVMLKPVDPEVLLERIGRALRLLRLEDENATLRRRLATSDPDMPVAESTSMQEVLRLVQRVAPTDATVLLTGETGTGKEVAARMIHAWGRRPDGPFVATDCASLPESLLESELFGHVRGAFTGAVADRTGHVEAAHGGTLFLDELGEMPLAAQKRLLRVLEEREVVPVGETTPRAVDVRVVCATNRDLEAEVKAGRFREDLYYRVNVVRIHIPPLRERLDDVPALVAHFTAQIAKGGALPPLAFTDAAMGVLARHSFPGNVRELRNVVERALLLATGPSVDVADLPPEVRGSAGTAEEAMALEAAVQALEVRMIRDALARAGGVQTRAAAHLGIAERVLRYKMQKYGIRRD